MKKTIIITLILCRLVLFNVGYCSGDDGETMKVLFTHDLHDRLESYDVLREGEKKNIGGFSRIKTVIDREKDKSQRLVVLDAGDFSMGTLYQTIFSSDAPSLRLLGELGYDATTLGNHEFDFRSRGLGQALIAAKNSGDRLPYLLSSNVDFKNIRREEEADDLKFLEKAYKYYGGKEYILIERDGVRIGVFGVMGDEAISNAPMAEPEFLDYIESSRKMVDILREKEDADLIIALSHSGTWEDKSKSEDEILAKKVEGIDLIISGHTHTRLDEPIIINNTIIASSGNYGENIGLVELKKAGDRWLLDDYRLIALDESIPKDKYIEGRINEFKDLVAKNYLGRFDLSFDQVLAYSPFNFVESNKIAKEHKEEPLANLIGDSYIYNLKEIEGDDYKPVAAAIVPAGTIRDSFIRGNISVSHVFNVSSLGIGPDKISGYPLVDVYLTGSDLKTAAEVDASIGSIMSVAQLYIAGLEYKINDKRLLFDRVTDIYIRDENNQLKEIEDDELYRVVAGLYTGQMLSIVKDQSFGLLSISPRDSQGNLIEDLEDHIIYKEDMELKEWYALANYLSSFEKEDGIPRLPDAYSKPEFRKLTISDNSIKGKIEQPNKFTLAAIGAASVALVGSISLMGLFIRRRKKDS